MKNKQQSSKTREWKGSAFLFLLFSLFTLSTNGRGLPLYKDNQPNQLDTLISGKRLIIKDTTKYDPSFIKGLKEQGNRKILLKDDSLLVWHRIFNGRKDTVVFGKFTIPTNLQLNKEIVFSTKDKAKSLILKRTNFTNIEYQLKNENKETIKSGTAILQSSFYFGAEMGRDENGKETVSRQYLNWGPDWTNIQVEIYQAKIASITYSLDPKAKKYQTISNLIRE
jgi:hypothetical protein